MPQNNTTKLQSTYCENKNNKTLIDIFGSYKNSPGVMFPLIKPIQPNINLTVDYNGNYKLVDLEKKTK